MDTRVTRSRSRQASQDPYPTAEGYTQPRRALTLKPGLSDARGITLLPFNHQFTGLRKAEREVLALKQRKLRDPQLQLGLQTSENRQAVAATLVFAQEEAGTAVCISDEGLLLTCAHCVADADGVGEGRWLLFASGQAVFARCVAWDSRRDLALLQIVSATRPASSESPPAKPNEHASDAIALPSIPIASSPPKPNASLLCIGHPGSEDLEASTSGILTDYAILHTSIGRFRGLARGQDLQDNSEIGALKHDCWTYWGHSGAPLISRGGEGALVGLHSSWDDETGMRRGVPLQALRAFLGECADGLEG